MESLPYERQPEVAVEAITLLQDLKRAHQLNFGTDPHSFGKREVWIRELADHPQTGDLRILLIAECREYARLATTKGVEVSASIQNIFLDLYRPDGEGTRLDLSSITEMEQREFLNVYLLMTFAGEQRFTLSHPERHALAQLCALSSLSKEKSEEFLARIDIGSGRRPNGFPEVTASLQSKLGLEGVDETILVQSFRASDMFNRELLDSWRARSGHALLSDLLPNFIRSQDLNNYQGREAVIRAIHGAAKDNPKEVVRFLKDEVLRDAAVLENSFDSSLLAAPLEIFYRDCLFQVSPDDEDNNLSIRTFNETLILSNDINQMLMGFSREIVRLSQAILSKAGITQEDFAKLLKYKIAFQQLKVDHFANKVEIGGFLKIAVDAAEVAMFINAPVIQFFLMQTDLRSDLPALLTNKTFAENNYVDYLIQKQFDAQQPGFAFGYDQHLPSHLSVGDRVQIDAVSGSVYVDGENVMDLPADIQNHPHMRALGLHSLPYSQEARSTPFTYYTIVEGRKIPQIRVFYNSDHKIIIQKKLPTKFGVVSSLSDLPVQYVAKEELSLPYAISHRLNIHSFWKDSRGAVYGYDAKGNLMAILKEEQGSKPLTVTLQDGDYSVLKDPIPSHPALKKLLNSVSPNEILVDWNGGVFKILPGD